MLPFLLIGAGVAMLFAEKEEKSLLIGTESVNTETIPTNEPVAPAENEAGEPAKTLKEG